VITRRDILKTPALALTLARRQLKTPDFATGHIWAG
jgi:hypothetical protein